MARSVSEGNAQTANQAYDELLKKGGDPHARDKKGRTMMHYAVKARNLELVKLLLHRGLRVDEVDAAGENSISHLLKGAQRITPLEVRRTFGVVEYLIGEHGLSADELFVENSRVSMWAAVQAEKGGKAKEAEAEEEEKGEERKEEPNVYRATPLIQVLRNEALPRAQKLYAAEVLVRAGASVFKQDGDGRDSFMYLAMQNDVEVFEKLLVFSRKAKEKRKAEKSIVNGSGHGSGRENVDLFGKGVVHYIVNPLPFGSYENEELLRLALKAGFECRKKDNEGKTPFEYALK